MNHEYTMPAEWEPHEATWLAWPYEESDFPMRLDAVRWVFAEMVRLLAPDERVEILCATEEIAADARMRLERSGVSEGYRIHITGYDRSWTRDSLPTFVRRRADDVPVWAHWAFNAWAKYDNYHADALLPDKVAAVTGIASVNAVRPDNQAPFTLEGGAFDVDGAGSVLVTEECLLSEDVQCRNPGMLRSDYEAVLGRYLGTSQVIWLGRGCTGDDTHGHIDDIARFYAPGSVLVTVTDDPEDEHYERFQDNLNRLRQAQDASGNPLVVRTLPSPRPVYMDGERVPASYANFYIGNRTVLVPTFNDEMDRVALATIAACFPTRCVIGVHARDFIIGYGSLHCSTQQQPRA